MRLLKPLIRNDGREKPEIGHWMMKYGLIQNVSGEVEF
jgi:hypothetical protein